MSRLEFTNNWFDANARTVWDSLIPQVSPRKMLEIGSYEGASACYLIDKLGRKQPIELHCVDTWEGGIEHQPGGMAPSVMSDVERRFNDNIQAMISHVASPDVSVVKHKSRSDVALSKLLTQGKAEYFDFIYIDGSHQAPDVLSDAVLSFTLLRNGGIIAFDDYLWRESLPYGADPLRSPKMAIDAFTNIYSRKVEVLHAPLHQLYVKKIAS